MDKILIIDDNKDLHLVLEALLKKYNDISIDHAYNGMEGYLMLDKVKPSLVILDNQMPVMSGFELLNKLNQENKTYTIIMLTAFGRIEDAVEAIKLGALDYITKPFDEDKFFLTVSKALKIGSLKKSKKISRAIMGNSNTFDNALIGKSPLFREVIENAKLVATTDIDVLIKGSNGTGKEEIAKLIHYSSDRADKPFVTIDCGAIPESLIESELFGSTKGSYTGAIEDRAGYFEQANTGTVFLDEIGNLPFKAQASLLRALQTRKIKRVGSPDSIDIDVRIICATNAKLLDCIADETFKEDLFHRINGFDITLPDLKDRKEDIPALVNHFITQFNAKLNRNVQIISPESMEMLTNYEWPGNIRELINCLQKAVLLSKGTTLSDKTITLVSNPDLDSMKRENTIVQDILDKPIDMKEKLQLFEELIIKDAVDKNKGNKSNAAKFLNISRKKLYERLKNFTFKK